MRERLIETHKRPFSSLLLTCLAIMACASCARLPRRFSHAEGSQSAVALSQMKAQLVHINSASPAELEKLPGIGRGLAARIVEYRKEYGRFRRAEHLMMVRGISARRFEAVRALITAE